MKVMKNMPLTSQDINHGVRSDHGATLNNVNTTETPAHGYRCHGDHNTITFLLSFIIKINNYKCNLVSEGVFIKQGNPVTDQTRNI